MLFAKEMYFTEGIRKKSKKILRRLKHRKLAFPVYLLAVSNYGKERLEILSSLEASQTGYPSEALLVIGIAEDYVSALELVRKITEETYQNSYDTDICRYLHDRERGK